MIDGRQALRMTLYWGGFGDGLDEWWTTWSSVWVAGAEGRGFGVLDNGWTWVVDRASSTGIGWFRGVYDHFPRQRLERHGVSLPLLFFSHPEAQDISPRVPSQLGPLFCFASRYLLASFFFKASSFCLFGVYIRRCADFKAKHALASNLLHNLSIVDLRANLRYTITTVHLHLHQHRHSPSSGPFQPSSATGVRRTEPALVGHLVRRVKGVASFVAISPSSITPSLSWHGAQVNRSRPRPKGR